MLAILNFVLGGDRSPQWSKQSLWLWAVHCSQENCQAQENSSVNDWKSHSLVFYCFKEEFGINVILPSLLFLLHVRGKINAPLLSTKTLSKSQRSVENITDRKTLCAYIIVLNLTRSPRHGYGYTASEVSCPEQVTKTWMETRSESYYRVGFSFLFSCNLAWIQRPTPKFYCQLRVHDSSVVKSQIMKIFVNFSPFFLFFNYQIKYNINCCI